MTLKIQIPEGWHRLRVGTKLRKGDKFYGEVSEEWISLTTQLVSLNTMVSGITYIRKNK